MPLEPEGSMKAVAGDVGEGLPVAPLSEPAQRPYAEADDLIISLEDEPFGMARSAPMRAAISPTIGDVDFPTDGCVLDVGGKSLDRTAPARPLERKGSGQARHCAGC
jgi:hypothetical protein